MVIAGRENVFARNVGQPRKFGQSGAFVIIGVAKTKVNRVALIIELGLMPARLFDETLKLFLNGHGTRSLEVLRRRGLLDVLLPATASYLDKHPGGQVNRSHAATG